MVCNSALQRPFNKPCVICRKSIGYGNYHTVQTKARKFKTISYPAKTLYVHTECYNAEHNQNLPIYPVR